MYPLYPLGHLLIERRNRIAVVRHRDCDAHGVGKTRQLLGPVVEDFFPRAVIGSLLRQAVFTGRLPLIHIQLLEMFADEARQSCDEVPRTDA